VPVGIRAPDNPPRSLVTIPTVPPLLPLKCETQIKITKLHISFTLTATVICDGSGMYYTYSSYAGHTKFRLEKGEETS
jgi:hypothetical protein